MHGTSLKQRSNHATAGDIHTAAWRLPVTFFLAYDCELHAFINRCCHKGATIFSTATLQLGLGCSVGTRIGVVIPTRRSIPMCVCHMLWRETGSLWRMDSYDKLKPRSIATDGCTGCTGYFSPVQCVDGGLQNKQWPQINRPHSPALSKVLHLLLDAARERSRMLSFTPNHSGGTAADMQPLLCILCGLKTKSLKSGNCLHFLWFTLFFTENGPSAVALTEESATTISLHFSITCSFNRHKGGHLYWACVVFFLRSTCSFWHSLFKVTILTPAHCSYAFLCFIKTDSEVQFNQFYTRMHAVGWLIYRLVSPLAYFNFILRILTFSRSAWFLK